MEKSVELTENMIRESVVDKLRKNSGYNIDISTNLSEIDVTTIAELSISFKSLTKINAMINLTNLRTLDLHNNMILSVDALSILFLLERLDISFNQVSSLEPLANLSLLKEINLSNNRIIDVSPLESLQNVQTLLIDNNEIEDIESFKGMAMCRTLNVLTVAGNPLCTNTPDYKRQLLSTFQFLGSFDFAVVARENADEETCHQEKEDESKGTKDAATGVTVSQKELNKYSLISIYNMCERLVKSDENYRGIEEFSEMFQEFSQQVNSSQDSLFTAAIENFRRWRSEVDRFTRAYSNMLNDSKKESRGIIEQFRGRFSPGGAGEVDDGKMEDENPNDGLKEEMKFELMETEMASNEAFEREVVQLRDKMSVFKTETNDKLFTFFEAIRASESVLSKGILTTLSTEKEGTKEFMAKASDNTSSTNALMNSHDYRVTMIDECEDEIGQSTQLIFDKCIERLEKAEFERSRHSLEEIQFISTSAISPQYT